MSDEEAHAKFVEIRWSDNNGKPYCPHCGSLEVYVFACRPIWRCKAECLSAIQRDERHNVSQPIKLPHRDYLLAIAIFVNGAKGHSALQLSRDLDVLIQNGICTRAQVARDAGLRGSQPRSSGAFG